MPIFDDDEDRECFIRTLEDVVKRFNWVVHAYCMMDIHYHLLVETIDEILSKGMGHLNGVYTQRFTIGTIMRWNASWAFSLKSSFFCKIPY